MSRSLGIPRGDPKTPFRVLLLLKVTTSQTYLAVGSCRQAERHGKCLPTMLETAPDFLFHHCERPVIAVPIFPPQDRLYRPGFAIP